MTDYACVTVCVHVWLREHLTVCVSCAICECCVHITCSVNICMRHASVCASHLPWCLCVLYVHGRVVSVCVLNVHGSVRLVHYTNFNCLQFSDVLEPLDLLPEAVKLLQIRLLLGYGPKFR